MSGPSFSNIDLWLFELSEGNLSSTQVEQLELFLLQNPDVDIDRDVWGMAKITPANAIFPNQEELERKRRPIAWFYISSAASIALLIGASLFSTNDTSSSISSLDSHAQLIAKVHQQDLVIDKMQKEIDELKSEIDVNKVDGTTNASTLENDNSLRRNKSNFSNESIENIVANNNPSIVKSSSIPNVKENSIRIPSFQNLSYSESKNREEVTLTKPVEELQVLDKKDYVLASRTEREVTFTNFKSNNNYKKSIKSKFSKFSRTIRRMANNPVALKNYRDPNYHVPGMLANDVSFSSTGTMLATRVQTLSRLQWYGEENEQMMNQLSLDGYNYGMRGGLGVQIKHAMYNSGGVNVASAALTYSPKLSLTKSISFEPSVRFKMGNKRLNSSSMNGTEFVEMERQNTQAYYPNGQTPVGSSLWYKDLGLGLMVNTEWFFINGQVDNLFRHEDNLFSNDISNPKRSDYHIMASAGTDWVNKKESMSFSPYIVYQKKEKLSEVWLGANFRYNWLVVGAGVSSLLDPAASIGLKLNRFAITYNADYTMSSLTNKRSLSHQVSIKFVGKPSRIGRRILNL